MNQRKLRRVETTELVAVLTDGKYFVDEPEAIRSSAASQSVYPQVGAVTAGRL